MRTSNCIKRDVWNIKQYSQIFLLVDNNNNVRVKYNLRSKLPVIAVIGPTVINGKQFDEAVLLEIGISRKGP
jgi:hypothetical protein